MVCGFPQVAFIESFHRQSGIEKSRSASKLLSFKELYDYSNILTLDLSEFNVNVMTGNNGAHQRSPYDPGIQK